MREVGLVTANSHLAKKKRVKGLDAEVVLYYHSKVDPELISFLSSIV